MYRNLIRWSLIRHLRSEAARLPADISRSVVCQRQWVRQISVTDTFWKKRRSEEEKIAESQGRRVIRYSPKAGSHVVGIWRNMTVSDVAQVLEKDIDHILKALEFADKTEKSYSADTVIADPRVVKDVVKICGCRFRVVAPPDRPTEEEENKDAVPAAPAPPSQLRPRAPVVCVMGHVDHGKTTLLDALRDSSVVDHEFGGITQHIGAFEVQLAGVDGGKVTFLDTPGHAAFSAMRARGAAATDLVLLLVAADDGVMQQTREAIRMAQEADVPILVAINKIDKPGVNIDKTLQALARLGVVCEALGGAVQAVAVSALKRRGLAALVEALALQAQLMDLRADYGGPVEGVVIEAQIDPHLGCEMLQSDSDSALNIAALQSNDARESTRQATVVVRRGTLRGGCVLVAGLGWARARLCPAGPQAELCPAGPQAPVEVCPGAAALLSGWRALPQPGDIVLQVPSEKRAAEVIRWRQAQRMKEKQSADLEAIEAKEAAHRSEYLAQLARKRALGRVRLRREGPRLPERTVDGQPSLAVLVKGDVEGSVEAIVDILSTYNEHQRLRLELVHAAVGAVTPSDIEIAEAFSALVFAFNVRCPPAVAAEAKAKGVPVREHNVIYRLVAELRDEISQRLPPTHTEEVLGTAEVVQSFQVWEGRRRVAVGGCRVAGGALRRGERARLRRGGHVVWDGKLVSLKRLKEEVSSVSKGVECGLRLGEGADPQPGDRVECYRLLQRASTTGWDPGF